MTSPRFSIVVPTRGRPEYLAEALRSVQRQTLSDFECLVVSDGDARPPELPSDPRFRLLYRSEAGGPAAARNTGLAAATGEAVLFLDDDDLYSPDRLELAARGLARAPVAICWASYISSAGPLHGRRLSGIVHDRIADSVTPHIGSTTVLREVLVPFDDSLLSCEDLEWWIRQSRFAVETVEGVGVYIRRHHGPRFSTGQQQRIADSIRLVQTNTYFLRHHRAAAFRWKRIGLMYMDLDQPRQAATAFFRSFIRMPRPRTAYHLLRAGLHCTLRNHLSTNSHR